MLNDFIITRIKQLLRKSVKNLIKNQFEAEFYLTNVFRETIAGTFKHEDVCNSFDTMCENCSGVATIVDKAFLIILSFLIARGSYGNITTLANVVEQYAQSNFHIAVSYISIRTHANVVIYASDGAW
ncbi:unnamed protein product [Rotaria magnacalcarata]|uniref:Uncharacterized protein n=1 Tax=Rotaria magnacalcarata TaxID=392030 RepID=A0A816FTK2_9BILA|nr:unnamed protein product [Rotaria magnacalcarata]